MKHRVALACAVVLGTTFLVTIAFAQTSTTTTSTTGAFAKLSPANQEIAQAIFKDQVTTSTTKPLTLDQIAALHRSGEGWGEIFNQLKAEGRVTAKNLGQLVSEAEKAKNAERAAKADKDDRNRQLTDKTGWSRSDRHTDFTSRDFARDFVDHGNVGAASPAHGSHIGSGNVGGGFGHGRR